MMTQRPHSSGCTDGVFSRTIALAGVLLAGLSLAGAETIREDTTWTSEDSPYLQDSITVADGATLTIEPGVEVRIADGGNITVKNGCALIANGSAGEPILITQDSDTPEAGGWWGVVVQGRGELDLTHTTIEYGGHSSGGESGIITTYSGAVNLENVVLREGLYDGFVMQGGSDSVPNGEPELVNVEIANCQRNGVIVSGSYYYRVWRPVLSGMNIHDCGERAIQVHTFDNCPVIENSTITGNGFDGVYVNAGNEEQRDYSISGNVVWSVPYIRATNNITVTIDRGAQIYLRTAESAQVRVPEGGALIIQGTAEDPVLITSDKENPAAGDCRQVLFDRGSTARIDHARFEYFSGILSLSGDVELRNTVIDQVTGIGFHYAAQWDLPWSRPVLIDTTISNCSDFPLHIPDRMPWWPVMEGLTLSNNLHDMIRIGTGIVPDVPPGTVITVPNPGYPFYLESRALIDGDYEVHLGAGTVFENGYPIRVSQGTLRAYGTPDNPIIFRKSEIDSDITAVTIGGKGSLYAQHCIFDGVNVSTRVGELGGYVEATDTVFKNVRNSSGLDSYNLTLKMVRCEFSGNDSYGAYVTSSGEGLRSVFEDCSFVNNGTHGIRINGGGCDLINCTLANNAEMGAMIGYNSYHASLFLPLPNFDACRITDNGDGGMIASTNHTAASIARNCWWGDASGPYHETLNPNGLGQEVSDSVAFVPWATSPDTSSFSNLVPLNLAATATGSTQGTALYAITLNAGDAANLLIRLTPTAGDGTWKLTEREGEQPTAALYDREGHLREGGHNIVIPSPAPGIYYVAVNYRDDTGGTGSYELEVSSIDHYLTEIETASAGNAGMFTQQLRGCGFVDGCSLELRNGGSAIAAFTPESFTASQLIVPMDLTGLSVGTVDVAVVWPDSTEEVLPGAFDIITGAGAEFWASFRQFGSGEFRPGRMQVRSVHYGNSGDADGEPALLVVSTTEPVLLTPSLDEEAGEQNLQILTIGPDGDAGSLPPGYAKQIDLFYQTITNDSFGFQLETKEADNTPIDWEAQKADLRPGDISEAEWDAAWPTVKQRLGATTADHIAMLVENARRLLDRGSASPDPAWSVSHLIDLEAHAAAGKPVAAISGRLLLMPWGRPQPSAAVKLYDTSQPDMPPVVARSNSAGEFCFNNLADGLYELYVNTYFLDAPITVAVTDQTDTSAWDVFIYDEDLTPLGPENVLMGQSPSLVSAGDGVAYMTWENGGSVSSLAWDGASWTGSTPVADADGATPYIVYDANLFAADDPGVLALWETMDAEQVGVLVWSAGRWVTNRFEWTIPQALTSDANDDVDPQIVRAADGTWMAVWLQRANGAPFDDTDLYMAVIDPTTAADWYEPPTARTPSQKAICDSLNFATRVNIPKSLQEVFGKSYAAEAAFELCEGDRTCESFEKSGAANIAIELGDSLKALGTGQISSKYLLNCKPCRYMPWTMQMQVSGGLEADFARPVPILVGGVPVGVAKFSIPVAIVMEGTLLWNRDFTGLPNTGYLGIDCTAGGRVVIEDNLGIGKGQGDLSITGSYQWNTTQGFKVDGACVTLSGEAAVFGGFAKRKTFKQWGAACGKNTDLKFGEKSWTTDTGIYYTRTLHDGDMTVIESMETVVSPSTGTGNVYEGTAMLAGVATDLYDDGKPAFFRDGAGLVTMVWTKDQGDYANGLGNQVMCAVDDGSGWTPPQPIETARHFNRDVALAQDSNGTLVAVWSQASAAGLDSSSAITDIDTAARASQIVASRFVDGNWTPPAAIATLTGRNEQPALARYGNRIAVAWVHMGDKTSSVLASTWNGTDWSAAQVVSTAAWCDAPAMAALSSSALLVWSEDEDGDLETTADTRLRYAKATSTLWTAPEFIPAALTNEFNVPTETKTLKRTDLFLAAKALPRPDSACCGTTCKPKYRKPRPRKPPQPRSEEDRTYMNEVASLDPNEKHGPRGWGATGIVEQGTVFTYTIFFENKAEATAPAQEVFVTDFLPEHLDPSTFVVKSIGWGNQMITFPSTPKTINEYRVIGDYREDSPEEWLVNVTGFAEENGKVAFTFRTLDTVMEEPPLDPMAGFLPPNDDTHRGEGYVVFSVQSKDGLPADLSVSINNTATIIFDLEDPIVTNEAQNPIGDIPVLWQNVLSTIMEDAPAGTAPDVNGDGVRDASDLIAE